MSGLVDPVVASLLMLIKVNVALVPVELLALLLVVVLGGTSNIHSDRIYVQGRLLLQLQLVQVVLPDLQLDGNEPHSVH